MSLAKSTTAFAGKNVTAEKAKEWINENSSMRFEENKGQILDTRGGIAKTVRYRSSYKGVDVYLTEFGLTYSYKKYEYANDLPGRNYGGKKQNDIPEIAGTHVYRLDIRLEGINLNTKHVVFEANYLTLELRNVAATRRRTLDLHQPCG